MQIDLDARSAVITKIPDHPEIARITGALTHGAPTGAAGSYHVIGTDGTTHDGSFAVVRGGPRPTSVTPPGAASKLTAFVNGDYAASLVTSAEASATLGRPVAAPTPNGGRLFYDTDIDVSNAIAKSTDGTAVFQYGIYRGKTLAAAQRYWAKVIPGTTPLPGIGDAAAVFPGYLIVYVLKGHEVAQIDLEGPDPGVKPAAMQKFARALAAHMGPAS